MTTVLQDSTFRQLRDFIYDRTGIFIADSKKYLLETRLSKRLQEKNIAGFDDYLFHVQYGNDKGEMTRLFDSITTNETYFFREPQQLEVFAKEIMPKVVQQKGAKDVKVWSAASSTGEEPYSLVMLARESANGVRTEVIASDLSEGVLASARRALYNSYSVRNVPDPYLKRYFKCNGAGYELDAAIKSAVSFRQLNLIDERAMRLIRGIDVIFCRNVLIYFDDKAKQRVVASLYDSLRPGGWLFVGTSESLHSVTRAFRPVVINKVVVYQKA